jgi:hypothetical protein
MKHTLIIYILFFAFMGMACNSHKGESSAEPSEKRSMMEKNGRKMLLDARQALEKGNYNAARKAIKDLRENFPLALNAREEAILLADSIELFEARQQLEEVDKFINQERMEKKDSLQAEYDELCQKVKFYLRKLQYDQKNKQLH